MTWTYCSSAQIIRKAGTNVNSTIAASSQAIADWEDMAEAVINTSTRKDWTAAYSGLGANFKVILSEAAACLAAMQLISYDMSGYTGKREAETMLDVLRDCAVRDIEVLKDEKNKEKMS